MWTCKCQWKEASFAYYQQKKTSVFYLCEGKPVAECCMYMFKYVQIPSVVMKT